MPNIFNILQIKDLKRGIKVKMSRKEVLEKTGELISLRYAITSECFIKYIIWINEVDCDQLFSPPLDTRSICRPTF